MKQLIRHSNGFTLLEIIISIGVLSIIMSAVFMLYHLYIDSFYYELSQVTIERDALNVIETMKTDLRDADTISTSGCYLVNFRKKSDLTTYSYYIQNTTRLVRVQGSSCANGAMLTDNIVSADTSVVYQYGIVRITLSLQKGKGSLKLLTSVYPRNV